MCCSVFVRRFQLNFNTFNKDELSHPHHCVLPVLQCCGHCSIELWQPNASPICVINEPKAWFEIFLPWPVAQCAPQTHLEIVIKDKMQDSMTSVHGLCFPNKEASIPSVCRWQHCSSMAAAAPFVFRSPWAVFVKEFLVFGWISLGLLWCKGTWKVSGCRWISIVQIMTGQMLLA